MAVNTGSTVIDLRYKPRPFWEKILHPALDQYRFSVIVAHRRFGKSVGCVNHLVKKALMNRRLKMPRYAYLAPFLKQAKQIAWEYLKYYTANIPNVHYNESELYVEFPSYYSGSSGARIYVIGADRPDGLRGLYWDGIIMDEYAQIKPELWTEVVRPMLSDRKGWAVFIGTPKGQNSFYDLYLDAQKREDWFTCLYTVDETGIIPEDELLSMKRDMTKDAIRQELYCDFTASAFNILIPLDIVNKAMDRDLQHGDYKDSPKIMGVDVARFGDDECVIFRRQGLMAFEPETFAEIDNMTFAGVLSQRIDEWQPDMVFIDSGRGEGVIDRLRQLGYSDRVIEVPFGGKAIEDTRYSNKRAEMWDNCRQWLNDGGKLPYLPELRTELTLPEYEFDAMNRIKLESKDKIKDRCGRSPDLADALCLTFAYPINLSRNHLYKRARRTGSIRRFGSM